MYERSVLPNGLRILTNTMPHAHSVSIGVFVGAGSRYETDDLAGASHFLEHLLFKGTETRPEPQMISGAIESVGGIMNASTDREATVYWVKVARHHFPLALDVLADVIQHPIFIPEELERERGVILEELAMTYDQPEALADLLIDQTLWPNQPMGRDVGGTKDSVTALPRQAIINYHAKQYVPNNCVISVAGNISHDEVVNAISELMGNWQSGEPLAWYPAQPRGSGVAVSLTHRRSDQAHLCLAVDGVPDGHPDFYALDILNTILGDGMSSRLFLELREKRGLAYDVHSSSAHYRDCGALTVYWGTEPAKVDQATITILRELEAVRIGISESELSRAVEYATGRLLLRLEDTRAVMGWMGGQELLRGRAKTPDEIVSEIRRLTPAQVSAAANVYLDADSYRMAVVGPYRSEARFVKLLAA